jgi:GT2 family glycosyltransferase
MTVKITFVAVVYNDYQNTYDFCQSIAKMNSTTESKVSCFLVDNSDNADFFKGLDALPEVFDFVKIFRPVKNLGYFGAFNYFFSSYVREQGEVIILCNNDLVFDADFCMKYLEKTYNDDVYVVCPDVITIEGIHQNPHVLRPWGRLKRLKLDLYFTHYYLACVLKFIQKLITFFAPPPKRTEPSEAGYLHMGIGACYVLQPAFLQNFKNLDFPFFLYGEEAYLTSQVHSAGGKLYYDPQLKVRHKESATLSKLPSRVTYNFGRDGYWNYRNFY